MRFKSKKVLLSSFLMLAMIFALAGCSSSGTDASETTSQETQTAVTSDTASSETASGNDTESKNETTEFVVTESTDERVVVGKENWLFFDLPTDGDPIGCYQGTNLLSDEELKALADNCVKQKEYLESLGKEFVIFVVPGKERTYCEYMPDEYGEPAQEYMALQIVNYLKENTDVRVVYPYDELMEAKEKLDENIWYKTDTHWNFLGAYVGACALLKELGIEMPSIYSDEITINAGDNVSGDLAAMLDLSEELKSADRDYSVSGYDTHNVKQIEGEVNQVYSFTAEGADTRKLYVYRDSFTSHMATYIGSQFNESYMRHLTTYTYQDFLDQDPDIFVYETAERYTNALATFDITVDARVW